MIFLRSAHTCPAHLSVIGGDFVLESVARYAALVRYSEFGGCSLFGSRKCTASTGIAVGTSTVVRYSEEVRYWEGPLSEVPLYSAPESPLGSEDDGKSRKFSQHIIAIVCLHSSPEPQYTLLPYGTYVLCMAIIRKL